MPARAADHFLTIGGGHSAIKTQASLEQNVIFFRDALSTLGLAGEPHEVLFADGNAGFPDVQFTDDHFEPSKVVRLLGEIYDQQDGLWAQYRPHAIPQVWGPAQRAALENWFNTVGKSLHDDDRLIIYYTGHGGSGHPSHNTTLTLWNEPDLTVKDFTALLDRLPPKVSVVLVMVQCYSGGFADVIFQNGDSVQGLSPRNRCGFFATTFDRTAAGCTSDIDVDDYHEYSTYFWAALCGHTRTGKPIDRPDFLHNGHITLAEAHAYTLLQSDTVDVPIKTSDVFLRQFSRSTGSRREGLLSADGSYDRLHDAAGPTDQAVLDGLSAALKLDGSGRIRAAEKMADDLADRRANLLDQKKKLDDDADDLRDALQDAVEERWPQLDNPLDARAQETIANQADDIVSVIESSPDYRSLQDKTDASDKLDDQAMDLERQWVKCRRLIGTAESVALAANLPKVCRADICQRFRQLRAAEDAPLDRASR
jgi:hypothetical protein